MRRTLLLTIALGVAASVPAPVDTVVDDTTSAGGGEAPAELEALWSSSDPDPGVLRHSGNVAEARYSPDGSLLATAAYSDGATLWDADTGDVEHRLATDTDGVITVAFSPDGATLATGERDGAVRLWDVDSGEELTALRVPAGETTGSIVRFSPDGVHVAATGTEGPVRVFDVVTGDIVAELGDFDGGEVYDIAFDADGTVIAAVGAVSRPSLLVIHDLGTDTTLQQLILSRARAVTAGHGERSIAAAWAGGVVEVDVDNGSLTRYDTQGVGAATAIAMTNDVVVAGDSAGVVWQWSVDEPTEVVELGRHDGPVQAVAVSSDGTVAAGGSDGSTLLWSGATTAVGDEPLGVLQTAGAATEGDSGRVRSVDFSADGRRVVTVTGGDAARVWDARTGEPVTASAEVPAGLLVFSNVSPDATLVAAAGFGAGDVFVHSVANGELVARLPVPEPIDVGLALSIDSEAGLVLGALDGRAVLWSLESGEVRWNRPLAESTPISARLTADGRAVLVSLDRELSSANHTVMMLDLDDGATVDEVDELDAVQLLADGDAVVTVESELFVLNTRSGELNALGIATEEVVWSAVAGDQILLAGPTAAPDADDTATDDRVVLVPDSVTGADDSVAFVATAESRVVVASTSGRLVSFDLDALREPVTAPNGHEGGLTILTISPDGTLLATAGRDRRVVVRDAVSLDVIATGDIPLTARRLDFVGDELVVSDSWGLTAYDLPT